MKVQSIDAALAGIYDLGKERFRSVEEFLKELAMKLGHLRHVVLWI